MDVDGRHSYIAGKTPMDCRPNGFALQAQIGTSIATMPALLTGVVVGFASDTHPHIDVGDVCAYLDNPTGDFVPHHDGGDGAEFVVVDMQIGPTNPGIGHFDNDMSWGNGWHVNRAEGHIPDARGYFHDCLHRDSFDVHDKN
jgi:hypothetical protein